MRGALGTIIILGTMLTLSGCADRGLRDLSSSGTGPDEFMIMPAKPLTQPKDYDVLPAPTPGARNLTDQNPRGDAVATVGGRPAALERTGEIPAADGALVNYAGRNGVPTDIRQTLAEQDAQFRKRQGRLTRIRLFQVDRYNQAYRRQALNPFSVSRQNAVRGVSTPTHPPEQN